MPSQPATRSPTATAQPAHALFHLRRDVLISAHPLRRVEVLHAQNRPASAQAPGHVSPGGVPACVLTQMNGHGSVRGLGFTSRKVARTGPAMSHVRRAGGDNAHVVPTITPPSSRALQTVRSLSLRSLAPWGPSASGCDARLTLCQSHSPVVRLLTVQAQHRHQGATGQH